MWYCRTPLNRRRWVPQPAGRGNLAPTMDEHIELGLILPFAPEGRYVYSTRDTPIPAPEGRHVPFVSIRITLD